MNSFEKGFKFFYKNANKQKNANLPRKQEILIKKIQLKNTQANSLKSQT